MLGVVLEPYILFLADRKQGLQSKAFHYMLFFHQCWTLLLQACNSGDEVRPSLLLFDHEQGATF